MRDFIWGSAFLILGLCLIRRIFAGRMSMRHQYALWILAVVGLCFLPLSIRKPHSVFSILNVADAVEGIKESWRMDETQRKVDETTSGQQESMETGDNQQLKQHGAMDGLDGLNERNREQAREIELEQARALELKREQATWIFWILWGMGATIAGSWMLWVNHRLKKEMLQNRVPLERESSILLSQDWMTLPVYLVKELNSPCLLSVRGEKGVYIPAWLLEEPESMKHAIAHEICHYHQWDLLWNRIRCAFLAVYWFWPPVWLAAWLSRQDCELSCDEATIRLLGREERFAYGRTLLSLVGKEAKAGELVCVGTFMTSGARQLKRRISWLSRGTKMNAFSVLGYYFLIQLIFLGACTGSMEDGSTTKQQASPVEQQEILVQDIRELGSGRNETENDEIQAQLSQFLTENHLLYIGDAVGSGKIVGACIRAIGFPEEIECSTELQTSQEPYVFRMIVKEKGIQKLNPEEIKAVSILAFASIENMGALEVYGSPDGYEKGELFLKIGRAEAMEDYGLSDLQSYSQSKEEMLELVRLVAGRLEGEYSDKI